MPVFTKGSRAATSDRNVLQDGHQFARFRPTMQAKGVRAGRDEVGRVLDGLQGDGEGDGAGHREIYWKIWRKIGRILLKRYQRGQT